MKYSAGPGNRAFLAILASLITVGRRDVARNGLDSHPTLESNAERCQTERLQPHAGLGNTKLPLYPNLKKQLWASIRAYLDRVLSFGGVMQEGLAYRIPREFPGACSWLSVADLKRNIAFFLRVRCFHGHGTSQAGGVFRLRFKYANSPTALATPLTDPGSAPVSSLCPSMSTA